MSRVFIRVERTLFAPLENYIFWVGVQCTGMVSITLPDAKLPFIWMQVRCWPELPLVSPTKRSWTTLGTFKDSCELQARIHTISTYILSWKVSNRKKAGAPKNQLWPLEKESFNESFLIFQVFHEHSIDGSALLVLTESHLTRILGLKLGPAIRLRAAIQELKAITNCSSDWILNIIHPLYIITSHIVFSIASLVFSK